MKFNIKKAICNKFKGLFFSPVRTTEHSPEQLQERGEYFNNLLTSLAGGSTQPSEQLTRRVSSTSTSFTL